MSLCQGGPCVNRRGRHADYLHGALVAVEARKRLSIKHVELDPVDAGIVGAGVNCALACSGEDVRYDVVHSYQDLLNVIQGTE